MFTKLTIEEFERKVLEDLKKFVRHVYASQYDYIYTEDDWYGKFADYVLEEEAKG